MGFRPLACIFLALVVCSAGARAQYAADTCSFKATQLIAPAALMGAGACIHYFGHESIDGAIRSWNLSNVNVGGNGTFLDFGTWVSYGTPAVYLGAGLLGAKSRHAFADRVIESCLSYGFCVGSSYILKRVFNTTRPDGTDNHSFPSGHTTLAFTGAELMRLDYGPWWGAAFYTLAGGAALERLYADRHWFSDLLAGAGLGILSAHIGPWLLQPVKSLLNLPDWTWDGLSTRPVQVAILPSSDPLSGTPTATLSVVF